MRCTPSLAVGMAAGAALAMPAPALAWLSTVGLNAVGVNDSPSRMAIRPNGEVVIVGVLEHPSSNGVAVKLTPDGDVAWEYERPSYPAGNDAAFDPNGDVVVAVRDEDVVAKLAGATGEELWTTTIDGTQALQSQRPRCLAVDAAGDVAVAGSLDDLGTNLDFAVVKLSGTSGAESWRYTLDGGASADGEGAYDVTFDPGSGAVVAVGATIGGAGEDATVVRLDGATGAESWRVEVDGAASEHDRATAVAVDGSGDVIVGAVVQETSGMPRDLVALKLDGATGAEIWRATFPSLTLGDARAVVDADGDVIVTARAVVTINDSDGFVAKIDGATGGVLWAVQDDTFGVPVALLPSGDVLVGAESGRLAVAVLSGDTGDELWRTITRGNVPAAVSETTVAVGVDAAGDVYATGPLAQRPTLSNLDIGVLRTSDRLAGRKLVFKDKDGNPSRRKLLVAAKDANVMVVEEGSSVDPAVAGAELVLTNPLTAESATMPLPAINWTTSATRRQHRYRDKLGASGPCTKAVVKLGRSFVVKCKGAGIAFSLDEPSQGALVARLAVPGGLPHCVRFDGAAVTKDAQATGGGTGIFVGRLAAPPATCP